MTLDSEGLAAQAEELQASIAYFRVDNRGEARAIRRPAAADHSGWTGDAGLSVKAA